MKDHAQYAEMLALYAVGALDNAPECPELEAHLRTCNECQKELAALRGDAALLALSAVGPAPPQGARQRFSAAISNQPRKEVAQRQMVIGVLRPRWLTFVPIAASLALAIFSLMLLRANSRLVTKNASLQAQLEQKDIELQKDQALVKLLKDPDTMRVTLISTKEPRPQPHIKTFYSPKMGRLLLVAGNLEPLPPNKTYELWLLPANGSAPMPCGTFSPSPKGDAMMDHHLSAAGIEAKGFAITVEPESGSTVPTPPIRFMGAG